MNDYYIYVYLDPTKSGKFHYNEFLFAHEPIYIGKGRGKRFNNHLYSCFNKNNKKSYRTIFYRKLRKIIKNGNTPIIQKIKINLTEEEAFELEKYLIKKIGKRIDKTGTLCNNSDGGEGASGATHSDYKVLVFNNDGNIVSIEKSVKQCCLKYNVSKIIVYKHCNHFTKCPYKNLRFRKYEKIQNIEIYKKPVSTKSKKVLQYDLQGNFIKEFPNAFIAAKELNICRSAIQANATGKTKKCNNFKFKYND